MSMGWETGMGIPKTPPSFSLLGRIRKRMRK
jgi:hypothetical protein